MNHHKLLNRITISMIIIFTLVMLLLAFLFVRHFRWRQVVDDSSMEILDNIEDFQSSSDQLQATVEHLRVNGDVPSASELERIDRQLDEINEYLEHIEDNMDDIAPLLGDTDPATSEDIATVQDEIKRTFLFLAWLVGITSVGTAIVAYRVLRPKQLRSKRRLRMAGVNNQPDEVNDRHT